MEEETHFGAGEGAKIFGLASSGVHVLSGIYVALPGLKFPGPSACELCRVRTVPPTPAQAHEKGGNPIKYACLDSGLSHPRDPLVPRGRSRRAAASLVPRRDGLEDRGRLWELL